MTDDTPRWAARLDAYRSAADPGFSDVLRIISSYYDMYERGHKYLAPYINRQSGATHFLPPDKDDIKAAVRQPRVIHPVVYHAFVNSLIDFTIKTKGKRQLITPNHTTHHSAQFPTGTFSIRKVEGVKLAKPAARTPVGSIHEIEIFGAQSPLYVENLKVPVDSIQSIIVRPKIGSLGTASAVKWEILFYRNSFGYLINHVDSDLNPRWSGIL